eukprot:CAMPEP_0172395106 /NCGR_PEP_ID=MMETSP1061-20121228/18127_1 /TAXON_ID=37318 /ORGANISM="Pseudo-nitzschia pungens, Strain cf. pungens" /LENGTH=339 /DNA_ID=CAMNT_0013126591 /DNA_START=93 /DNA_END=1109 /DNA_ORIENTATION=-
MTEGLRRTHITKFFLSSVLLLWFYDAFIVSRRELKHIYRDEPNVVPAYGVRHADDQIGDCMGLGFTGSLDALLHNVDQVYVSMPAKAAGSSMKKFATTCMNVNIVPSINLFNKRPGINNPSGIRPIEEYLTAESLHPPSLIASHLYKDTDFTHLVKHSTRRSLIIYMHRDETSRILSGITQVAQVRLCPETQRDACVVPEIELVAAIKKKTAEIGFGSTEILTCDSYDALDDNAPNFVFVHYKQASRLQKLLAKRFCPIELNQPSAVSNVFSEKAEIRVMLQNIDNRTVSLKEWLEAKKGLLEFSLELRESASCQAKTRAMEEKLFYCPDEAFHFGKVW